ncbi:MAG TPA: PGF-CTERM sorting domain-containing protein [Methanosarcinaceae archaeon]|nr:PGF-CTERM sorting domain-containing protein [Methanosarcinaceae archaeon]
MACNKSTVFRIFILASILLAFTLSSGCLRSFEEESRLRITNMDISAKEVKSAFVDIDVTTYVENFHGDSSKNTSLLLKAFSTRTGLLEVQTQDDIGIIDKGDTVTITQSLKLQKEGGYRIVAVLFEEDKKKNTGEITIYSLENLPADVQDIGIEVAEMDFLVREVDGGRVVIQSDLYLTNEGTDTSGDYQMLIKAREMDARLLADKEWMQTGSIKPETTVIRSLNLTVPNHYNYVVEVLIWNNDTIVKRGEDYVQLKPQMTVDVGTQVETKHIETSDFIIPEEARNEVWYDGDAPMEEEPGFGILLGIVAILSVVLIQRRREK